MTRRNGWPRELAWHSAAAEDCVDAFVRTGRAGAACLALARDRAAAGVPLVTALTELDALFLCALAHPAPGPVVQAYVGARGRSLRPGTLPPDTDPFTELPSAGRLQRELAARAAAGRRPRLVVLGPPEGAGGFWTGLRHLLLLALRAARVLGEEVHAGPAGRLMAVTEDDDEELGRRLDLLSLAPVDPLAGPAGPPAAACPAAPPRIRVTCAPARDGGC